MLFFFALYTFEIFYYTYTIEEHIIYQPWENRFKERGADGWMNEGINEW